MEDWQHRVINEEIQLAEKVTALTTWLNKNNARKDLDKYDLDLLRNQALYMHQYLSVLRERIARWKR